MHEIFTYIHRYGYAAIFFGILLENFGVPLPGETLLVAGALAAGAGELHIVLVLLLALTAAVVGDNIGYAIGFFGGRRLVLKYGKYIFITEKRLQKLEGFFERYGNEVVAGARFVSGLRQLNGIIAGLGKMHWAHFLLYNMIGAILWVGIWGGSAYSLGRHYHDITRAASRLEIIVLSLFGAIAIGTAVYYHFSKRGKGTSNPK